MVSCKVVFRIPTANTLYSGGFIPHLDESIRTRTRHPWWKEKMISQARLWSNVTMTSPRAFDDVCRRTMRCVWVKNKLFVCELLIKWAHMNLFCNYRWHLLLSVITQKGVSSKLFREQRVIRFTRTWRIGFLKRLTVNKTCSSFFGVDDHRRIVFVP